MEYTVPHLSCFHAALTSPPLSLLATQWLPPQYLLDMQRPLYPLGASWRIVTPVIRVDRVTLHCTHCGLKGSSQGRLLVCERTSCASLYRLLICNHVGLSTRRKVVVSCRTVVLGVHGGGLIAPAHHIYKRGTRSAACPPDKQQQFLPKGFVTRTSGDFLTYVHFQ